jgi:hypothetical protein
MTSLVLMVRFAMPGNLTSFDCPYFVMHLSLGLTKVNLRLIASDDICERSIVVFKGTVSTIVWRFLPEQVSALL